MQEILPGLFHWTASHPKIKIAVSSYYVVEPRVLIDPLIPAEGLDWFRQHGEPRDILLSNRHHYRHCAELEQAFGCSVWCNREGLHEFQAGEQVRAFTAGDVLPGNIESYEVGALADALEFDHLLLAHGEPWIGGAREALRRFAAGEEP